MKTRRLAETQIGVAEPDLDHKPCDGTDAPINLVVS